MKITPKCGCNGGQDLMFCCSGAADTAEIADLAVRLLHKAKEARMFCLAGIAGEVEVIVANSLAASRMVVVDGCDSDCAKKTMEQRGFNGFVHIRVTDLGWEKGKTPVTEGRIGMAADRIRAALGAAPARGEA
jgi:uncharacterized metal-binding protein